MYKYYRTELDLLGVRRMADSAAQTAAMRVQSFWKEPLDIEMEEGEFPNINFQGQTPEEEEWREMAENVKGFMRLVPSLDGPNAPPQPESPGGGDEDSSVATDVGVDEFRGIRIPCPVYGYTGPG